MDWPQLLSVLMPVGACVGACVGGYVAIRADLARIMERATSAKEIADSAHRRIDGILQREHQ